MVAPRMATLSIMYENRVVARKAVHGCKRMSALVSIVHPALPTAAQYMHQKVAHYVGGKDKGIPRGHPHVEEEDSYMDERKAKQKGSKKDVGKQHKSKTIARTGACAGNSLDGDTVLQKVVDGVSRAADEACMQAFSASLEQWRQK